jgi:hypothetical protein
MTPVSYRNLNDNLPFASPTRWSSRKGVDSVTNNAVMTDVTNFKKARLPLVARRLKLEQNDTSLSERGSNCNDATIKTTASSDMSNMLLLQRAESDGRLSSEGGGGSIQTSNLIALSVTQLQKKNVDTSSESGSNDAPIKTTSETVASTVLKRTQEFEQDNIVTRHGKQVRDVKQLGRQSASRHVTDAPTMTEMVRNVQVNSDGDQDNGNIFQNMVLSPSGDEGDTSLIAKRRSSSQHRNWKRFWEILYAVLAILELLSCQGFRGAVQPKAVLPPTYVSVSSAQVSQYSLSSAQYVSSSARIAPFGVTEGRGYWGQNAYNVMMHRAYNAFVFTSWQDVINKVFILAIFLHTMMESWALASSRNSEKRQREEQQALKTSTLVTRRSKRRFHNLETASSNRHFIMKWTRNRIRWNRATTEILRASCFILLLRLLFFPFLRRQGYPYNVNGRTLSFGESVIMDVTLWFHSRAVTHYRRKVKEYAVRFATLALTRPWETSVRVQNVFTLIRWIKFLAPRIGTFNKLRGHLQDYNKKKDQKQRSEKARLLWSNLIDSILVEQKVDRAIRRIQRGFKARRERTRLARAKRRLSGIGLSKQILSDRDRELADSLRREIRERSRKNRRLLLRPNTTFSVAWKRTTITCVAIEVSYLLLSPMLSPKTRTLTLDEVVMLLLAPAAERFAPLSWLQVSTVVVELVSHRIAHLVSTVSFLDVFITFFTGELDGTGLLVPKPFFNRWIFPGVVLQLIVNPTMKDISAAVRKIIAFSNAVGPMRVFHVSLALLPIMMQIVNWSIDITYQFVDAENRSVL